MRKFTHSLCSYVNACVLWALSNAVHSRGYEKTGLLFTHGSSNKHNLPSHMLLTPLKPHQGTKGMLLLSPEAAFKSRLMGGGGGNGGCSSTLTPPGCATAKGVCGVFGAGMGVSRWGPVADDIGLLSSQVLLNSETLIPKDGNQV